MKITSDQIIRAKKGPKPDPNPVRLCSGDCGRMTRPSRMRITEAPDTVCRASKDMCRDCFVKFDPPKHRTLARTEIPDEKLQRTLSALDAFTEARNKRLERRRQQFEANVEQFQRSRMTG